MEGDEARALAVAASRSQCRPLIPLNRFYTANGSRLSFLNRKMSDRKMWRAIFLSGIFLFKRWF
jgi:hypothetical protein